MNTTFVDTSFLFAYLLTDAAPHERARAWQTVLTGSRTGTKK
jgi:predicted nucleic acid-binding protein